MNNTVPPASQPPKPPTPTSQSRPSDPVSAHGGGWTRPKQAAFLHALAFTHNVGAAARAVGMSRQSAYRLRARLKGEPFDLAWSAAFQSCFDALAEAAMERALHGVEVPHYHQGELVGTSRRFDERLTVALLAMRRDFLPRKAAQWHPATDYPPEDFPRLLARVAQGPETWRGEPTCDYLDGAGEGPDPALEP